MTSNVLVWDQMPSPAQPRLAFLAIPNQTGLKWVKANASKVGIAIDLPATLDYTLGKPYRKLDFEIVKLSTTSDKSVFCVFCIEPGLFEIFEDLCRSLIKGLEGIDDPHSRADTTIVRAKAWSELFRLGRRELTSQQILGLLCELRFLAHEWLPLGQGVDSWVGPDRKSQDFVHVANKVAVEVKHMNSSKSVSISSIHQLEFDGTLFLAVYQLREDTNGISLNELVEQLLDHLDPLESAGFSSKLIRSGYEQRPKYDERYIIADSALYEVIREFPKVVPGTVPSVVAASYTLELDSSCDSFMREFECIGKEIEPR